MKNEEILIKLEESQEKVRKFCQWSYNNVQSSLVKFKTQTCILKCKYTICNSKMSFHKVRVLFNHAEYKSGLQIPSYMHCSKV